MANTYLDGGTSQNFATNAIYVGNGTLKLGHVDVGQLAAIVPSVMGVDLSLGKVESTSPQVGSVSDRPPNLPSGYSTDRTPLYGANPSENVWATDGSRLDASFSYNTPLAPSTKDFNDLT